MQHTKLIIGAIVIFIALLVILPNLPIVVVGAGERGVVFNNGSGVEGRVLGEGTHFVTPFVEHVTKMSIQTQANNFEENAGTSDSQTVDTKSTVNWHIDPNKVNSVYQNIGNLDAVYSKVILNSTQDAIKAATSKYVALDIQRNRDKVGTNALQLLQDKVKKYGVVIDGLSLTNINFSAQFNQAVENAQKANQDAIAAENQVKQVEAEAKSAIAKAQGEAEAQKQVQQTLTPELLQKLFLEKWNGILPQYIGGGNPIPFLNLGK